MNAPTFFVDVDGTLIPSLSQGLTAQLSDCPMDPLPGVYEFINAAHDVDATVILTTSRPESNRDDLESLLSSMSIAYDGLIMGLPKGPRVVINDRKPGDKKPKAFGLNVTRNHGLGASLVRDVMEAEEDVRQCVGAWWYKREHSDGQAEEGPGEAQVPGDILR